MQRASKIHEKFLSEIWKKQNFTNNLFTKDGQKIEILESGIENNELGGPDFKNARIKIGNLTYFGDVEIDSYHSDWKTHGHSINKKYNKVILHAVLEDDTFQPFVFTQEGRKIQSIGLNNCLCNDLRKSIHEAILSEREKRTTKLRCDELNQLMDSNEKLDLLFELGVNRFKLKCSKMYDRLKEISYVNKLQLKEPMIKYTPDENFYNKKFTEEDFIDKDVWNQMIYESTFEALGYSKNKDIMFNLAKSVPINYLKKFANENDLEMIVEAVLFNVSGLIPDVTKLPDAETIEYTRKLKEIWANLKYKYDGKTFHAAQWHFFKLRPQNFPTVRLAGGCRLVYKLLREDLFSKILKIMKRTGDNKKIISDIRNLLIVKSEGYWQNHYIFDQPAKIPLNYFLGLSRVDEIIVNVLLPSIAVYYEIFGQQEYTERAVKIYSNYYQNTENNLVDELSKTLNLNDAWKRSVLYQGMIELFRSYCSRDRCLECTIGKKVFN
jgi:hypothetical protein